VGRAVELGAAWGGSILVCQPIPSNLTGGHKEGDRRETVKKQIGPEVRAH